MKSVLGAGNYANLKSYELSKVDLPPEILLFGYTSSSSKSNALNDIIIPMYSFNSPPKIELLVFVLMTKFADRKI